MQALGYDPLGELVRLAMEPNTAKQDRLRIAELALPYIYPKLSAVTMDGEIDVTSSNEAQRQFMSMVLSSPQLGDAASVLALASANAAIALPPSEENDDV